MDDWLVEGSSTNQLDPQPLCKWSEGCASRSPRPQQAGREGNALASPQAGWMQQRIEETHLLDSIGVGGKADPSRGRAPSITNEHAEGLHKF